MKESDLLKQIQMKTAAMGVRLFRNNVAKGWIGKARVIKFQCMVPLMKGDVVIRNARRLNSGLCVGSSDLIGWTPVKHDGKEIALFTAIVAKTKGTGMTEDQRNFIDRVKFSGGLAFVMRDFDDIEERFTEELRLL